VLQRIRKTCFDIKKYNCIILGCMYWNIMEISRLLRWHVPLTIYQAKESLTTFSGCD
jgi:hypothetical protein